MTTNILIADDDPIDRAIVKRALAGASAEIEISEAATGAACVQHFRKKKRVDCLLLDWHLPDMDGLEVLTRLGDGNALETSAVVVMTGNGNESIAVQAMKRGVQDYLVKGQIDRIDLENVINRAMEVKREQLADDEANRNLRQMAMVDGLTGVGSRNLFEMRIDQAIKRARRESSAVCLLLMDLDGFKQINDTLGHMAGDEVLKEIGQRLSAGARDSDTVARLGGDEFVLIMETGASIKGARIYTSRLAADICQPIMIAREQVRVGVSIGVARFPDDGDDRDTLLRAADADMYRMKRCEQAKRRA